MPYFSAKSEEKKLTCDKQLQDILDDAIKVIDFSIICGFRDREEQNDAVRSGASKLHFPLSRHNSYPSEAVDLAPYWRSSPHIRWGTLHEWAKYPNLGKEYDTFSEYSKSCIDAFITLSEYIKEIAKSKNIEIVYGGDWKNFKDYPHYELKK